VPPGGTHTSYSLLTGLDSGLAGPPAALWASHREWFWPQADSRSQEYGQLCWSNASLKDFLVTRVKGYLRQQPSADLISVSQNDNDNYCQTAEELAIVKTEGSPVGPMVSSRCIIHQASSMAFLRPTSVQLHAVNFIADEIADEFPHVAVATLAYGAAVTPPIVTSARPNVVILLAPLGADYAHPFTHPNNKALRDKVTNWGKKCSRLFIWNYVGGFEGFIIPVPNYYTIAPDIAFLAENGVTGIFNEAAYIGPGGDFAELNDYMASKIMWEPSLNGTEVMAGFLRGYYGREAAHHVQAYIDVLTDRMLSLDYFVQLSGWDFTPFAPIFDTETVVRAGAAVCRQREFWSPRSQAIATVQPCTQERAPPQSIWGYTVLRA
jgi:hypothetical protein